MKELINIFSKKSMSDLTRQELGALSMDLKRAALGYFRNSNITAERFMSEAVTRKNKIETKNLKPYLSMYLEKVSSLPRVKDKSKVAEDALMYSTIFQNAAIFK